MKDILERLRDYAPACQDMQSTMFADILHEAADEIERLRAAAVRADVGADTERVARAVWKATRALSMQDCRTLAAIAVGAYVGAERAALEAIQTQALHAQPRCGALAAEAFEAIIQTADRALAVGAAVGAGRSLPEKLSDTSIN